MASGGVVVVVGGCTGVFPVLAGCGGGTAAAAPVLGVGAGKVGGLTGVTAAGLDAIWPAERRRRSILVRPSPVLLLVFW
jgi:hypothetical protein